MENLQLDSDFTDNEYRSVSVTFGPLPLPGSVAVSSVNGVSGPTISFVGGSSGFTFSPAGTTIILASPLTTKGDILVRDATTGTRLAVGSNGDVLTADSAQATGVKWAPASGTTPDLSIVTIDVGDSPYALSDADDVVLVDATGGDVTITLHDVRFAKPKPYYFKLVIAGNQMILDGGAFNIDGVLTQATAVQYVSFTLIPDTGVDEWFIV